MCGLCKKIFPEKDQERMLHLISLDMTGGYFAPSKCNLDEEEKENSSCGLAHTVAMDLNREILVKM